MSPYAYPPPPPEPPPPNAGHLHDGDVIGDFAAVGALAAIDIVIRQDVQNGTPRPRSARSSAARCPGSARTTTAT